MFKIIRDTQHQTNETIFTGSKDMCIQHMQHIISSNNYIVSEYETKANWLGYSVIKTPFNNAPNKHFYIVPCETDFLLESL